MIKKVIIGVGIAGIILLNTNLSGQTLSKSDKQYVQEKIKQKMSSEATSITDFGMQGKTFYYTFETYTPYPKNEQKTDINNLTRKVCNNHDTLKVLKKGAIFDYTYKDKDYGKPLLHFQITLKDCR